MKGLAWLVGLVIRKGANALYNDVELDNLRCRVCGRKLGEALIRGDTVLVLQCQNDKCKALNAFYDQACHRAA